MIKPYLTYSPYGHEYTVCSLANNEIVKMNPCHYGNGPWQVYRMVKPFTKHYVSNQKEGVALMKSWVGEFHIPAGVKL
jgi:hypothetical protein